LELEQSPRKSVTPAKATRKRGTRARALSAQVESSFPRKRESRAIAVPLALDPRFRGGDGLEWILL